VKGYRASIRRRIILAFSALAIFVSVLFSVYNFVFAYSIEDEFFNRIIEDEARYIVERYTKDSLLAKPRQNFIRAYHSIEQAPDEIKALYLAQPGKKEYPGSHGRHYHVFASQAEPSFILVAEVSEYLMVRPMTRGLLIFLGISSVIMLLLAWLVGYWLAKKSLKPLSELAQLVERTEPENLPESFAESYTQSEVGILARSLEVAIKRIRTFIAREQHFTRDASHELRTPIAVIKGATELLEKKTFSSEDSEIVARIKTAVVQMEQTVNTLLTLAREEADQEGRKLVPLLPIVEQTVIDNAYLIDDKPVEIKVDISPEAKVYSTAGIIQILLSNLISNAFQYTPQGEVVIRFKDEKLVIFDSGTGIDESIKRQVFEPLVKGEESRGFGIGMSIVKRLCERQKFSIEISSSTRGTEVTICFDTATSGNE